MCNDGSLWQATANSYSGEFFFCPQWIRPSVVFYLFSLQPKFARVLFIFPYTHTALQLSRESFDKPRETTLFLKQGFRLMAIITDLLWKFIQRRTEQAFCERILNKEVTPTPILPPIKKERERSTELEGMRMDLWRIKGFSNQEWYSRTQKPEAVGWCGKQDCV